MRRLAVLAAVAAVFGVSCGGDEGRGDRAATVETTRTTEEPHSTATTRAVETEDTPTEADLRAALLAVEDLPTGFTAQAADEGEDDGASCGEDLEETNPAAAKAAASFAGGMLGPFVQEELLAYEPDEAEAVMARGIASVRACQGYTDDQGQKFNLSPLSFPDLGDETFAARLDVDGPSLDLVADVVVLRQDDVIAFLFHASTLPVDSVLTERLARTALAKLPT